MSTTQNEIDNQIINQMVSHLGGNKFMVMTGSKPQYKSTKDNPLVAFKLVKNISKANYLTVSYVRGTDLYKMEFVRIHGAKRTVIKELDGLYADMLQPTFTEVTGMYTSL